MDLPYLMISIDLNSHSLTKIPPLVPPPQIYKQKTMVRLCGQSHTSKGRQEITRLLHV